MAELDPTTFLTPESISVFSEAPESVARAYATAISTPSKFRLGEETITDDNGKKLVTFLKAGETYRREFHLDFLIKLEDLLVVRGMGMIISRATALKVSVTIDDREKLRPSEQLLLFADQDNRYMRLTPGYDPPVKRSTKTLEVDLTTDLL